MHTFHFCIDTPTLLCTKYNHKTHITSCGASHVTVATNFLSLIHNRFFLFEQVLLEGPLGPATDDCRVMFSYSDELPMHFCITKSSSHSLLLTSLSDSLTMSFQTTSTPTSILHTLILSLCLLCRLQHFCAVECKQTAAIITAVTLNESVLPHRALGNCHSNLT